MTLSRVSFKLARRMALRAQLLHGRPRLPAGKEGIARTIEQLGYVQIDTIAVVERAHHHTLWTRRPYYDPRMLHELQAKDQRIFEYWTYAASYLPMVDYRYYLPRMRNFEDPKNKWAKERLEKHRHLLKPVLERIRREGPLSSQDFEPIPGSKRGPWWDWKPAKVALELLFWRGDVMIAERRNFQKIYDLTERVLPADVDTRMPLGDELGRFLVRRALLAHGVAREREIRLFMQPGTLRDTHIRAAGKDLLTESLEDLIAAGEVTRVQLGEERAWDSFALTESLEGISRLRRPPRQVHLISPFDSLIIQRHRIKRLFGFDYALECYVPAQKRKYGYFVLPILWGERFVGRLDPKVDRARNTLIVRSLMLEPEFEPDDEFLCAFAEKLSDFARFNRCERVELERVSPAGVRGRLGRALKSERTGKR
jgi:uncharacterized protein YcaQ